MSEQLLSVGIDIGTSTTQLIFSRLTLENRASSFTVPRFSITDKEVIYRSAVHFTPLLSDTEIDADAVRDIVSREYASAGVVRGDVATGAVIITGETARKANARQVLAALSGFAGDFVVATAGPDLESVLAARGAGADRYSEENACAVLNFDIGGGTSNLALFDRGALRGAGCMNVGGRLIKLAPDRTVTYVSPVLAGRTRVAVGDRVTEADLAPVVDELVQALCESAGLAPRGEVFAHYLTTGGIDLAGTRPVFCFSGGVADLIYDAGPDDPFAYGDIGVLLGRAIAASALMTAPHIRGAETIRATVIGAGAHAVDVSGSTISYGGVEFPMKNLPVVGLHDAEGDLTALPAVIRERLLWHAEDGRFSPAALALHGPERPHFADVQALAAAIASGARDYLASGDPLCVVTERDMAKALGACLTAILPPGTGLVCLDCLSLQTGQYLDVGAPAGGGAVVPVVIKTLIFTS